jgi:hypothetical protein
MLKVSLESVDGFNMEKENIMIILFMLAYTFIMCSTIMVVFGLYND